MATYKVIQDIEAEDKFVGPLTLKQFIFGMGGCFFAYLSFYMATQVTPYLLFVFVPPAMLGFFLAFPWSRDQPTELWVLAKLRYYFKPRKRIWDQTGLQELVTVTAPKIVEKHLTKDFSQDEVKSRLKALAETIDSRGWAVKNASIDEVAEYNATSDRLVGTETLPQEVPDVDIATIPDVMDESSGATTSNIEHLMAEKDQQRKARIIDKMERIRRGEPLENIAADQAVSLPNVQLPPMSPADNPAEAALSAQLRASKASADLSQQHMRHIGTKDAMPTTYPQAAPTAQLPNQQSAPPQQPPQVTPNEAAAQSQPIQAQVPLASPPVAAQTTMTTPVRPDILDLAQNNDLNVATIARQSHKNDSGDEVVISLR